MGISLKQKYVRSDGWRGYYVPVNAVGGVSDTGTWEDSPCPTDIVMAELAGFNHLLRKAGIKFKTTWAKTSNVFAIHRYTCVNPEDRDKALEIAKLYREETAFFFPEEAN
jgi:hypothetical protein